VHIERSYSAEAGRKSWLPRAFMRQLTTKLAESRFVFGQRPAHGDGRVLFPYAF